MLDGATAYSLTRTRTALMDACASLRPLYPDYPRVYAVAAIADEGKRRWWRLADGIESGRIDLMYARAVGEMSSRDAAAATVATSLIHAVVGRVVALVVLDGRAWDPGIDNVWIHMDSDGGIDWAGVADTTLRVLPDDPLAGSPDTVTLPCERALAVWTAHRCVSSLDAIYERLHACTGIGHNRFWDIVGESVVGAATYVPILARSNASDGQRRGQALLDAIAAAGRPVRGKRVA